MSAARECLCAFVLSVAGIAAAAAIIWTWESRALARAVSLPAVSK